MYKTEYSFTWKIENFSFCHEKNGIYFNSPHFTINSLTDRKWVLRLYPRGKTKQTENFISCFLCLWGFDSFPAFDLDIKIIGPSGKILNKLKLCNNRSSNKEKEWGSSKFLSILDVTQDACNSFEDSLTVCCKVYGKNSTADDFVECIAHTKIGIDRQLFKCYSWYKEGRLEIHTDREYFKNEYFKFSIASKDNNLNIKLSKPRSRFSCFVVNFKITLLNLKLYETFSERYTHYFQEKYCTLVIPLASFVNELNKNLKEYQHCAVKCIYFNAEFSFSNEIDAHFIPNKETFQTKPSSLQVDLENLFYCKKFSDVKLRVDDQVIEAHKNVLASRSPVFAVMFDQNMTETQTGIVDIVDIDAQTLKLFLQFLYTETVYEMDYEVATNLLIAAEKYQVLSLIEKCCMFLKNEISEENVGDILCLANAVNHDYLKSASIDFIIMNPANFLSSPQWKTWSENNKELATIISSKLASNMSSSKTNMCRIN